MYEVKDEQSFLMEQFEELESTNLYIKEKRAEGVNRIVTARKQTGGRGTKGRSFSSEEGGMYLTKLDFYENYPADRAFEIMANAASAVCDTLAFFGLKPQIKWANDVFVGGRKICGILVENTFSGKTIASSVVGIGLNVYNELPEELASIATSMRAETGKDFTVEEVTEKLVEELTKPRDMQRYLSYIGFLGKEANLIFQDGVKRGRLVAVDELGGLLVDFDGERVRVTAGEVSLRDFQS